MERIVVVNWGIKLLHEWKELFVEEIISLISGMQSLLLHSRVNYEKRNGLSSSRIKRLSFQIEGTSQIDTTSDRICS